MACVLPQVWGPSWRWREQLGSRVRKLPALLWGCLLQGPAWASSQHGSHRLVQNFPHGSRGLRRQSGRCWSQPQRPEPRHWHPVTPTIPMGQSSPRATQTPRRGHRSTPLDGNDEKSLCGPPLILHKERPRKRRAGKTEA